MRRGIGTGLLADLIARARDHATTAAIAVAEADSDLTGRDCGVVALRYWLADPRADDPTDSQVRMHAMAALARHGIALAASREEVGPRHSDAPVLGDRHAIVIEVVNEREVKLVEEKHAWVLRRELEERVAETSEALMEKFIHDEPLTADEIRTALRAATIANQTPVVAKKA